MTDDQVPSDAPEPTHAVRHYGKYSAGYTKGLERGRYESRNLLDERERYRSFLRDLLEFDQTAAVLPEDWRERLYRLVWGA